MDNILHPFANNTNTKTFPPPQQVYVNKQHVDKQRINSQRGFTIIEVALVLAIAGLIFLVVFLALPALQNSQKDTARKQDVGRVVSALQQYEADNNGLPSSGMWYKSDGSTSSGFSGYLGTLSQAKWVGVYPSFRLYDPGGDANYGVHIAVYLGQSCPGSSGNTPSDAAVAIMLTSGTAYCADM